jgi:histidinol-phosphate aminotransferase
VSATVEAGGYSRLAAAAGSVRLDLNEAPSEAASAFRARLLELLAGFPFNRYPEIDARGGREAAGALYGCDPAGIVLGNGSNELLLAAARALLPRGGRLVTPGPSFSIYPVLAARTAAQHVTVPLVGPRFEVDGDRLLAEAAGADLVVLCSPNNPTGGLVPEDLLRAVLALGVPVAWDAAYVEFSEQATAPWLARHNNLLVFRSCSKAWGLAGLRVGALLTTPGFRKRVVNELLPYGTSWLVSAAYIAAAEHGELGAALVAGVVAERERQCARIGAIPGLELVPSAANFFLVRRPGLGGKALHGALAARNIAVRHVPELDADGWVRISVGAPAEGDALVAALAEVAHG